MPTIVSTFTAVSRQGNTNASDRKGDQSVNHFYVDLKAADLVANNIIDLGILPPGHTVVDAVLVPDDLDTGAGITLDVGILSGTIGDAVSVRTCGTELFSASTAAQTGTPARISAKSAFTIAASQNARSIGAKIVAAPTGATAGRLRLIVTAAPVDSGFAY